jgi:antagonist of KipI
MLKLIDAGVLATIQDAGRFGYQADGVPVSGAMDEFSFSAANALVQNDFKDAAIEIHSPITLETDAPALIALTGAEAMLKINGRTMPQWATIFARAGSVIEIVPARAGGWQYLAIHGGVDVPLVLGSRSTFLRGKFGGLFGRALESSDEIAVGEPSVTDYANAAGRSINDRARAFFDPKGTFSRAKMVRVIPGPHNDWFDPTGTFSRDAMDALTREAYYVTASADRMGYRLRGAVLARNRADELISVGVPLGALQVPADGQPIALMADHQTTGGYPIIATIIGADMPIIAQCVEGDAVQFRVVEVDEAQRAWREMWEVVMSLRATEGSEAIPEVH